MPIDRNRLGAVFLTLVVVATLLLTIDVMIADSTPVRDSRFEWAFRDGLAIDTSFEKASPGDVVVLRYVHYVQEPILSYDFVVTEHEDAHRIQRGETPRPDRVYFRVEGITASDCCDGTLHFKRPEAPPGEPDDRIAMLFVYHLAPGVLMPQNETDEQVLIATVNTARSTVDTAETVPASTAVLNRVLLSGAGIAGLGAVVAAFLWARSPAATIDAPAPGKETEALVALVYAGRDHLRAMRGILLAAVAFLLLTGTAVLTLFFVYLEDFVPPPTPAWHDVMRWSFVAVWAGLAVAALAVLARVERTLRRWESHLAKDPLGP